MNRPAWSGARGAPKGAPDGWEETRAQTALATQIARDENDYLAVEREDVGRLTGENVRELFVSCDPAQAMQQQFEHLRPEFIAVHDIGTASSQKLLAGVAAASQRQVQKLVIRRQGYGTALASLHFIELPTAQGKVLRMYSTEVDGDTASRHGLARMLLAFSRLGVVMVGDLPPHSMAPALAPLREAIAKGPWHNRQLLLLPLAAASTLVSHGIDLAQGSGVTVRTTPQVARPADAWGFITASWSRLGEAADGGQELPRFAPAAALRPATPRPLPQAAASAMKPMPVVPSAQLRAAIPPPTVLERYLRQLVELTGMVSCCLFDVATGRDIAHAGASPNATQLALHGTQLLAAMGIASRTLGLGHVLPDAAITLGAHHLLLRAVPNHPGLALHAVLDRTQANLTLARLQIQRMDPLFDEVKPV